MCHLGHVSPNLVKLLKSTILRHVSEVRYHSKELSRDFRVVECQRCSKYSVDSEKNCNHDVISSNKTHYTKY